VTAGQTNDQGLYLRDDALGSRVAPHVGAVRFAKILAELETRGFPRRDAAFDGRYWPAIRDWLDRRHGLRQAGAAMAPDGEEHWDDKARPDPGPDPPSPQGGRRVLLECAKPVARSPGASRTP
jgi:hypothetical protein